MLRGLFCLGLFLAGNASWGQAPPALSFPVGLDAKAHSGPVSGRLFITITRSEPRPVSRSVNWFNPEPTFAMEVKNWKPGETQTVGPTTVAYPVAMDKLPAGTYYAQAVLNTYGGGLSPFGMPGNLYSKPKKLVVGKEATGPLELILTEVVVVKPFVETDKVKFVELESEKLSKFFGKKTTMRAAVVLPESYTEKTDKKYPVVYEVTGFGGDHTAALGAAARKATDVAGEEMLWVVLDGNCQLGHHVFADSANNGPVGTAFVTELIPHIEKTYRGVGKPHGRFTTGHSSGGWSSLWLQVAYPDTFGGCWSTSPDPVDFRDFQRVNLYEPNTNLFVDAKGEDRALSRGDKGRTLTFRQFSRMEEVTGPGGQLHSFEACFSARLPDGSPRLLWNRQTGAIDPETAKTWEPYDIRMVLEKNWSTLGPKLKGKLHVYTGGEDTFYLDGAVALLKQSQAKLGSDADIEIIPKKTHSLVDRALRTKMNEAMKVAYLKGEVKGQR